MSIVRLVYWHGSTCCRSYKEVVVEVPVVDDTYCPPPPPRCTRLMSAELEQKQFPSLIPGVLRPQLDL